MSTTKVTDSMRDVTQVDAAKITTGTIPEARIATLASTKLTGTIADARISASSVNAHVDLTAVTKDISLLALQTAINGNLSAYGLTNSWIEQFENSTYIENLSTCVRTAEYMTSGVPGSQAEITRTDGTAIGEFTSGGGNAAAFDGTTDQSNSAGAHHAASDASTWLGKDWGSGVTNTVTGFKVWSSNNDGMNDNGSNSSGCSLTLYGNTVDNTGTAVNLGGLTSLNFRQNNHVADFTKLSGLTTTTAYRYHWIKFTTTIAASDMRCAEIQFFENPTTLNATGSFNSTDVIPQDTTNKSEVGLVILYKDAVGTATFNGANNLVGKVRANTGQAYQEVVLAGAGTYSDGMKIAIAPALSVTAGQALSYEIEFAGQGGSFETTVHGVAMTY